MAEVSVIVPAWNAAETLGATLDALARQDFGSDYEVVVVDNGSTDATGELAAAAAGPVRVVRQGHTGPGAARNRGVAEASAPLLAFTDADCAPASGWIRAGVAALAAAELVQGAVRPDPAPVRLPFDRTVWVDGEAPLYETANLFIRRELFERLGGFEDWVDPAFGDRPFAEDIWLGWRARRAGARIAYCGEALVHHAVFRRRGRDYVRERLRLAHIPALVRRIPELRRTWLFAGVFLDRRTAAFDAALVAAAVAAGFGMPLVLAGAVPYAWQLGRGAWRWRRRAPLVAAVELAADLAGFAALLAGSLRTARPVI